MIYLTGDTHGLHDFKKLKEFKFNKDDILIILGDCGLLFYNLDSMNEEMIKEYKKLDIEIIYIDGNHENFPHLNALDVVNHRGAKMHKVSDKIYHLLRGEIFEIEDKTFLGLGGVRSIDKSEPHTHLFICE